MLRRAPALLLALGLAATAACGGDDGADGDPADTAAAADTAGAADADDDAPADAAPGDDAAPADDTGPATDAASDAATPECPAPTGARPPRLSEHAGIYDPVGHRVVLFGGSTAASIGCAFSVPTFENGTWIHDLACGTWRKVDGPAPPARVRHMAAYDSARHRMIVFGGRYRVGSSGPYTLMDDVWAFDLATETWSELPTTSGPTPRVNGAFVYDPTGDRALLFGGNVTSDGGSYDAVDDTWELALATGTWTALQPTFKPAPRLFAGALWDDARQSFVVFGGADETAFDFQNVSYFDDLLVLDLREATPTWRRLDDPLQPRPQGRFWAGLVHDVARDRYVMFGGHDDAALGNRNDLWAFDPGLRTWAELAAGDVQGNPNVDFCDFPPDFTVPDYDAPERRSAHLFVAGPGAAWTYGGKTDCGAVDDLVALDLASDTWEEVTTATQGESCLRKGGLTCNDLCF